MKISPLTTHRRARCYFSAADFSAMEILACLRQSPFSEKLMPAMVDYPKKSAD
jgi:hypothetical protein